MIEATIINSPDVVEEVPILPKKRGRKPKNRDQVLDKPSTIKTLESKEANDLVEKLAPTPKKSFFLTKIENTILYFPIKGDITNPSESISTILSTKSKSLFSNKTIDISGPSPYDPNVYVNMHADFENASHSFAFVQPEPKKNLSLNAINKNVKIVPLLGHFMESNESKSLPLKTDICCYWCTEQFENQPIGLPEKKVGDTFFVKHCFCSFNCMTSFNFSINDEKVWERYALINLMYKKIYNLIHNIKIDLAPPREALLKFGGKYTVEQFRELCKEKSIKIMSFPVISIQTYLEEMNASLNGDNGSVSHGPSQTEVKNYLDKVHDQYKLSRKSTSASKNTLEFCMGLKKV
jgi:hypothetical protein